MPSAICQDEDGSLLNSDLPPMGSMDGLPASSSTGGEPPKPDQDLGKKVANVMSFKPLAWPNQSYTCPSGLPSQW